MRLFSGDVAWPPVGHLRGNALCDLYMYENKQPLKVRGFGHLTSVS